MNMRFKNTLHKIKLLLSFIILPIVAEAQEQLVPLNANLHLLNSPSKNLLATKTTSIVSMDTLPFFDDFSYAYNSPYPTQKHWIDYYVYVNVGFATAPKSLGVATFDGLDQKGYPYDIKAATSVSAQADVLTSRPINLEKKGSYSYSPGDSVYLSFYYQAKGNGDWPESSDSLCLDLFKPSLNKWVNVWSKAGYNPLATDTNFRIVMKPIKDIEYFDSLFQFRFRNKATLSGSLDHWHIDYVYLNKGRTYDDTVSNDVAFAYMPTPFLKNYSKMPYSQYVPSEFASTFKNTLRNNDKNATNITYYYDFYNQANVLKNSYSAVDNILPFQNMGYQTGIAQSAVTTGTYIPASTSATDTIFKIKHYIKTSSSDYNKANDTVVQNQTFSRYYAYDDGTAEVGYYNNTYGAKMAVRYTLNNNDTLRGMNIYFDPITKGNLVVGSSFRLMVWNDGGNGPGTTVMYRDSFAYPKYLQGNYNMIPTYKLTTCLPLGPGTYYFGIQQSSNQPLNIGFDRNRNHYNSFYYDIGSGWTQSALPGSIMINPTMGCNVPVVIGINENEHQLPDFSFYPNPAQDHITVRLSELSLDNTNLIIYSTLGQTVLNKTVTHSETIDISALPNGVYFIRIEGGSYNRSPKKLVISR